ncbi:MAG: hypothetical protein ACREFE_09660, partial [Limisphaerales bacterium]
AGSGQDEFILGNYLVSTTNWPGAAGIFLNEACNYAYVVGNAEPTNFSNADLIGGTNFSYLGKSCLLLQPVPAPGSAAGLYYPQPGEIYMNSTTNNLMGYDMNGYWHTLW